MHIGEPTVIRKFENDRAVTLHVPLSVGDVLGLLRYYCVPHLILLEKLFEVTLDVPTAFSTSHTTILMLSRENNAIIFGPQQIYVVNNYELPMGKRSNEVIRKTRSINPGEGTPLLSREKKKCPESLQCKPLKTINRLPSLQNNHNLQFDHVQIA